jgi:hypothetical protein
MCGHHIDMARDTQRQKTYDAAYQVFKDTSFDQPVGIAVLEQVTELITSTPWWITQRGERPAPHLVLMPPGAKKSSSYPYSGVIKIASGMDTVATLCHEMTHLIKDAHTAEFRGTLIELLRLVGGDAAADQLRAGYALVSLGAASAPLAKPPRPGGIADFILDAPAAALEAKVANSEAEHQALGHAPVVTRFQIGPGAYAAGRFDLLYVLAQESTCSLLNASTRAGIVAVLIGSAAAVHELEARFAALDARARLEMLAGHTSGSAFMWHRAFLLGFAAAFGPTPTEEQSPFIGNANPDHPQRDAFTRGMDLGYEALQGLPSLTESTPS